MVLDKALFRGAQITAFIVVVGLSFYSVARIQDESQQRTKAVAEATQKAFEDSCVRGNDLRQAMSRTILIFVPRDNPRVRENPEVLAALDKALDQFKPVNCSKVGPEGK